MSERIAAELIERIRQRLQDDWRRTGDGDWQRTPDDLRRKWEAPNLAAAMLAKVIDSLPSKPVELEPVRPINPMTERDVAKVEKSLGFKLPLQLRQLYLEIGDGNFGPWFGIRRLSNWAKDYAKLRAELPEERGREWPEALLPIVYLNGKRVCVDRDSGAVVLWDKPPKKASEKKWLASFIPQSPSVEAWLERWVDTPTAAMGGPDGGWAPPEAELERREAVVRDVEAKRAAEAERARTVSPARLAPLPDDLLDRIRARAMDPQRRTYWAGIKDKARPFGLDDMEDELERNAQHIPGHALAGLSGMLKFVGKMAPLVGMPQMQVVTDHRGGMMMMDAKAGGKLGAPATEAALAHADAQLGFPVPEPLRQLLRIADGGFGPCGNGFSSLANMIACYRRLTASPPGPGGEHWPAKLFPVWEVDEEIGCLDLETGGITTYDPSRMQDIHGGYWRRSFAKEEGSLAELMEKWLASESWVDAQERKSKARAQRLAKWADEDEYVRRALEFYSSIGPEQRAAHGLPDLGWEDVVRRRHGSD